MFEWFCRSSDACKFNILITITVRKLSKSKFNSIIIYSLQNHQLCSSSSLFFNNRNI